MPSCLPCKPRLPRCPPAWGRVHITSSPRCPPTPSSPGILVELPLAPFFLKKFRGAYCDINDLPTLDPELYRCGQ